MRSYTILLISLLTPQSANAFQVASAPISTKQSSSSCTYMSNSDHELRTATATVAANKKKKLISKLRTSQLSALTQLNKDAVRQKRRNSTTITTRTIAASVTKSNKERLLKLGIVIYSGFLTVFNKTLVARATTPLMVTHSGGKAIVTPLEFAVSSPGMGLVEMPGMRGMSITSGQGFGLPTNSAIMFFALALFVTHTLLRNAGTGYVKLVHFMTRFITTLKDEERVDIPLGLAKQVGWDSYSHDVLDPLTKKSAKHGDDEESGGMYRLDTRTNLFEQVKSKATGDNRNEEAAKLDAANKYFIEQKHTQRHHPVYVKHSNYIKDAYLDAHTINEQGKHHGDSKVPWGYLDMYNAKRSTWDVYKHQLEEVQPPVSEADALKEDVSNLQDLMKAEQSMYQTSNQALKLAMDAHTDELHHALSQDDLKDFDTKLAMNEELKSFDMKAQEYEDTVVKDATKQDDKTSKKKNVKGVAFEWMIPDEK